MSSSQVMDRTVTEQCPDTSLSANQSFTTDEKSLLANSSFENSPSLDREKFLRYSARSRDEFWDALSSNYDYLMDDGLIASCREASSDLSLDDEREIPKAIEWNFTQFIEQFKWLHDLLHNIQVAKEGGSDNSSSKIFEDQQKVAYLCKLFNDQAQRLSKKYPDMRDEVHRHLNRLNNKWKAVEQSINPNKVKSPSKDSVFDEISLRMRNLRKWIRDLENRLSPVNPTANWTLESLESTYKEREELQKEIEVKGKCISSLLKLCNHLKGNVQFGQNSLIKWDSEQVRKVAHNLERKWHSLWLESLQNQCILEDLIDSYATDGDLEKSFSEEPLKKYPRLSSNCKELLLLENELKDKIDSKMEDAFIEDLIDDQMQFTDILSRRDEHTLKNDKGVMVGDTGIAELKAGCQNGTGKFEIIQDVGYSSETSAHLSNDEKLDSPEAHLVKNVEHKTFLPASSVSSNVSVSNQVGSLSATPNKPYLPPDKYPSISLKTLHLLSDDNQFLNSKYGNCKSVPDSFYKVTSVDEEVLDAIYPCLENENVPSEHLMTDSVSKDANKSKVKEVSNQISHLNIECSSNSLSLEQNELDKKGFLIKNCFPSECHQSSYSIAKRNKRGVKSSVNKTSKSSESWKKSSRVQEWLNKCESVDDGTSDDNLDSPEKSSKTDWLNKTADSSCDASGEYTTTESDSEKSNMSDVNNSVTMSQSFTGSIETVIPVVQEENGVAHSDKAASIDPSAGVRMRKKKRISRERPWSVTDVHQTLISSVVPHSTSESALDLLCSPQDSKKLGSKKFNSDSKRLSLTDISTLVYPSCPSIKSLKLNPNAKTLSCKLNFSSEKPPSRRKKISVSDIGTEKCDLSSSSASQKENSSIENSDTSKSKASVIENKNLKVSCSSLERSLVSENEKNENAGNTEEPESISDVAWDEYQDPPYLSEPYSEQTVDEDEVKKLINFGDDYRAVLGSYSDASSVSLKAPPLKTHKLRSKLSCRKGSSQESRDSLISDSNSDSEDFHNVLKTSNHALQFVSTSLKDNVQKMTVFSSEFAELYATCQTNLCHLHAIHDELSSGCELDALSKEDIEKLKELIQEWNSLRIKLLEHSRTDSEQKTKNADLEAATIDVHRSLATLEEKLNSIDLSIANAGIPALSLNQLQNNIKVLQSALSHLQDMKESHLSVSVRILRLIDGGGGPSMAILRESATKLYQQWEDVYELNCSQLTKLQALQSRWHESTESEMNSSSETTVQWQPVQVGGNLPTPQVSTEELFQNTAAEVQVAGQHDVLFEIETESAKASVQCIIEDEKDDFSDPVHLLSPPVLNMKKSLGTKDVETASTNSRKASCFWRTLRATVPFQFALVILYCMSSLMEPNCCDNMNNYDFSLSPHLHYFGGPPPV